MLVISLQDQANWFQFSTPTFLAGTLKQLLCASCATFTHALSSCLIIAYVWGRIYCVCTRNYRSLPHGDLSCELLIILRWFTFLSATRTHLISLLIEYLHQNVFDVSCVCSAEVHSVLSLLAVTGRDVKFLLAVKISKPSAVLEVKFDSELKCQKHRLTQDKAPYWYSQEMCSFCGHLSEKLNLYGARLPCLH